MRTKWISVGQMTLEAAREALAMRDITGPVWVRWFRTFDNPHGGGPFGKSKEYCTCELVGVTGKRVRLKDYDGLHSVDPSNCSFAIKMPAEAYDADNGRCL